VIDEARLVEWASDSDRTAREDQLIGAYREAVRYVNHYVTRTRELEASLEEWKRKAESLMPGAIEIMMADERQALIGTTARLTVDVERLQEERDGLDEERREIGLELADAEDRIRHLGAVVEAARALAKPLDTRPLMDLPRLVDSLMEDILPLRAAIEALREEES
jgi:hypothetical protein